MNATRLVYHLEKFPPFSSVVNKTEKNGGKTKIHLSLQVSAEVCAPGQKKGFLKVDGEWNGKMMAKWASGKNEVFIDVSQIPIHDKLCMKVAEQARYESRRLWREVTYCLKVGNIQGATAGKFALEQRQREEAAQRKETGTRWETKLFHQVGENWFFNEPLAKRVSLNSTGNAA